MWFCKCFMKFKYNFLRIEKIIDRVEYLMSEKIVHRVTQLDLI